MYMPNHISVKTQHVGVDSIQQTLALTNMNNSATGICASMGRWVNIKNLINTNPHITLTEPSPVSLLDAAFDFHRPDHPEGDFVLSGIFIYHKISNGKAKLELISHDGSVKFQHCGNTPSLK